MDNYELPPFFRLAKIASYHSNFRDIRYQMGAVIVKNKSVISFGYNLVKTHPKYSNEKDYFTIHRETKALINVKYENINGCSIYIYRQTHNGLPALAKPCKFCFPILAESGITRLYYTIPEYPFYKMEKI